MMNLACRNADLHSSTYSKLKNVFQCIYSRKIPAEVNEVVYCIKSEKTNDFLNCFKENYSNLTTFLEKQTKSFDAFDMTDLESYLKEIM